MKKNIIYTLGLYFLLQNSASFGHDVNSCSVLSPFIINSAVPGTGDLQIGDRVITFSSELNGTEFFDVSLYTETGGTPKFTDICSKILVEARPKIYWRGANGNRERKREQIICHFTDNNNQVFQFEASLVNTGGFFSPKDQNCVKRLTRAADQGDSYRLPGNTQVRLPRNESIEEMCQSDREECFFGWELRKRTGNKYTTVQRGTGFGLYQ